MNFLTLNFDPVIAGTIVNFLSLTAKQWRSFNTMTACCEMLDFTSFAFLAKSILVFKQ